MNKDKTDRRIPAYSEQLPNKLAHWRGLGLGMGLGIATLCLTATAQVPQPVLRISTVGTNQVLVNISNAVSTANYEIYRTPALADPFLPWTLHSIGTLGQSNFTLNMGGEPLGFFQAGVGSDWDGDGIPNFADGNPSNPGIGILTISITSPVNGSTFN
jgi:hypothetical protein